VLNALGVDDAVDVLWLVVALVVEVDGGGVDDDDADVCMDVCRWLCLSVAATSACEVPPAVTGVNTRGNCKVVDRVLDGRSAMLMCDACASTCDLGGSYRMFEGEDGDADVVQDASRCSSSSTLRAADKGKRGDGGNIDENVEEEWCGLGVEVEGQMEEGDEATVVGGGEREDGRGGMSLSAADMSAMVCCTPRMKAASLT
jgi:hypothetical protein